MSSPNGTSQRSGDALRVTSLKGATEPGSIGARLPGKGVRLGGSGERLSARSAMAKCAQAYGAATTLKGWPLYLSGVGSIESIAASLSPVTLAAKARPSSEILSAAALSSAAL